MSILEQLTLSRSPYPEPFFCGTFSVARCGELRVELKSLPPRQATINTAGLAALKARRPSRPNATFYTQMEESERANLLFRFVRDLFHPHYHHKTSNDSITRAFPEGIVPDWRNHTERAFYRTVITARRGMSTHDLAMALGRLAYLNSFRSLFGRSATPRLPARDLDPLRQSLEAAIAAEHAKDDTHRVMITSVFVLPFALLGLLLSAIDAFQAGVGNPLRHVEFMLRQAYAFVTSSVELVTILLVGTGALYLFALSLRTAPRIGVEREVARLGQSLRRQQRQAAQQTQQQQQQKPFRGFSAFMTLLALFGLAAVGGAFSQIIRAATEAPQVEASRRITLESPFFDHSGSAASLVASGARFYGDGLGPAPEMRLECWNGRLSVALRLGEAGNEPKFSVLSRVDRQPPRTTIWNRTGTSRYFVLEQSQTRSFAASLLGASRLTVRAPSRGKTVTFNLDGQTTSIVFGVVEGCARV
ncbi:hypothetical protein U91I_02749 [alpha proteobacterium U9-1i]|nr:hypothetical protein U91I_02749 [alpha proteobacterium U9-1i]